MIKKINTKAIIVFLLILIGFLLRVYKWSQLNTFAGDEGIQLIYAEDILSGRYFTATGEVSSLDQENKYILHNSPLGLYFQAILYLLSFKTAELYLFSYVILNMITMLLLYKSLKIISSKKVSNLAGIILLFSQFMLNASVWISQPVNALFFESIAIYLIAKFIKQKKDKLFLIGTIASVVATQMYPPMYLLLIPKIILFTYLLKNHVKEKLKVFLYFVVISTIIYTPFIVIELKYDYINTKVVLSFIKELATYSSVETINKIPLTNKFDQLTNKIFSYFCYNFQNNKLFLSIYTGIITFSFLKKSNRKEKKLVLFSAVFLFLPIIIFSLLLLENSVSGERAYIDIIFPYLIIFFALIHSKVKKIFISFFIVIYILITILPMRFYFFEFNSNLVPLSTIKKSVNIILNDAKKEKVVTPLIHVVSEGDKWGWDSSIYWYLLEQKSNKNLVSIDFYSNKPKLNSNIEPESIYLICHNYPMDECLSDWKIVNNSGFYKKQFSKISNIYNINQNKIIILNKNEL